MEGRAVLDVIVARDVIGPVHRSEFFAVSDIVAAMTVDVPAHTRMVSGALIVGGAIT
jgi:hypothetical protein